MCNIHQHLKNDTYQVIDSVTNRPTYTTNCITRLHQVLDSCNAAIDSQRSLKGHQTAVPRYTSLGPHTAVGNAEAKAGRR